jgi:hypothetical protein
MVRPSKYTPERVQRVVEALEGGNTRRAAASAAGIDEGTLERWMRRFAGFAGAVSAAEATAELAHVATIKRAAEDGDWRASLAWLERRRNEDWGRQDRLEIINTIREKAVRAGLPDEEVAEIVAGAVEYLRRLRRGVAG